MNIISQLMFNDKFSLEYCMVENIRTAIFARYLKLDNGNEFQGLIGNKQLIFGFRSSVGSISIVHIFRPFVHFSF